MLIQHGRTCPINLIYVEICFLKEQILIYTKTIFFTRKLLKEIKKKKNIITSVKKTDHVTSDDLKGEVFNVGKRY
jgi:hypothetical protein